MVVYLGWLHISHAQFCLTTDERDVIVRMGFFIGDLHRHIEQMHLEQYGDHSSRETVHGLSWTRFIKGELRATNEN